MTTIGSHGNATLTHDPASQTTQEAGRNTGQGTGHERTQHGNAHQHAAKLQSAKVHAAQVAKTKLNTLHAQQRTKAARRAQIVAFYRNHKFATVTAGKAASVAAQKMLRQFGERPRPGTSGKAMAHKRSHVRSESHEAARETERESSHELHHPHAHAGEHAHGKREAHPHPKHLPHRHQESGQHRDQREREQGRHPDAENDDAPEQGHKHDHGRGQDEDQSQDRDREQRHGQDQGRDHGQGVDQEQKQNQEQQRNRDGSDSDRVDGVAGFAKATRRGVISVSDMASASRAVAPNALQRWAHAHRGALDLSEQLASRYAKTLVSVAPKLEFGAALTPLMLLSLLSPMSARRDAARFASQRAAALASAPTGKSSITASLLGHAQDANEARQWAGLTFTDAQQTLTTVRQWLMDATASLHGAADVGVKAVSLTSDTHDDRVNDAAHTRSRDASHNTSDVRVSAHAGDVKP